MAQMFKTAEEELSFILGNDEEQLLNRWLNIDLSEDFPVAFSSVPKYDGDLDSSIPFTASGTQTATPNATAIHGFGQRAVIPATHCALPCDEYNDPLMSTDLPIFNQDEEFYDCKMMDFNHDLMNDILPPSGLPTSTAVFDIYRRFGGLAQKLSRPPQLSLHYDTSCLANVHPARKPATTRKGPLRKRKFDISLNASVHLFTTDSEKAKLARTARKMRRLQRARNQAINLAGRGNIKEIKSAAVLDSDLSLLILDLLEMSS